MLAPSDFQIGLFGCRRWTENMPPDALKGSWLGWNRLGKAFPCRPIPDALAGLYMCIRRHPGIQWAVLL